MHSAFPLLCRAFALATSRQRWGHLLSPDSNCHRQLQNHHLILTPPPSCCSSSCCSLSHAVPPPRMLSCLSFPIRPALLNTGLQLRGWAQGLLQELLDLDEVSFQLPVEQQEGRVGAWC